MNGLTYRGWYTVKLVMLTGVIFNVFLKMSLKDTLTEIKFNVKLVITNLINHRKKIPPN